MARPASVDEYLARFAPPRRAALDELRDTIRAAAPGAEESIAYEMPAFREHGRFVESYAAFRDHYSLFPASAVVIDELGDEIRPYLSGKGTIRFPMTAAIPTHLVARIVEIRVREVSEAIAARAAGRRTSRRRATPTGEG
jgi:uncharacterized protein YdhG (YjbR/CyaY superfamily)